MTSKYKYQTEIESMMFTFGEVRYPLSSTLELVEEILHSQAIEWIFQASEISAIRGIKTSTSEDIIFLVRHQPAKVCRLKEFLSWKEVRKNVRTEPAEPFEGAPNDEEDDKETPKKKWIKFSWEFPNCLADICDSDPSENEEDTEFHYQEVRERLEEADKTTKEMTKEEYIEFAECRQASFTYKKSKKFRDWLGLVDKNKPTDEVLEILGFLLWEGLRVLTVESLKVKNEKMSQTSSLSENHSLSKEDKAHAEWQTLFKKRQQGLFIQPETPSPLQPEHIQEAYSRLQSSSTLPLRSFQGGLFRNPIHLI